MRTKVRALAVVAAFVMGSIAGTPRASAQTALVVSDHDESIAPKRDTSLASMGSIALAKPVTVTPSATPATSATSDTTAVVDAQARSKKLIAEQSDAIERRDRLIQGGGTQEEIAGASKAIRALTDQSARSASSVEPKCYLLVGAMQLIKLPITADFVEGRTRLSWREVAFGLENELLATTAAPDLAARRVANDPDPAAALVELAGQSAGEPHRELVAALAATEPEPTTEAIQRTWLSLALAWLFEHRAEYADPLGKVEEVYADFGYPEEIASLVRYMPTSEPDLGSREANEARLYHHWRHYLRTAFAGRAP